MIDLSKIRDEIDALNKALEEKQDELKSAEESNLKELSEQYGTGFGCRNCAYSCCVLAEDYHIWCTKDKCILCHNYCDKYIPENELSKYIRDNHYYDETKLNILNICFNVDDIMHEPELHKTALEILKLLDEKENQNDTNT